MNQLKIRTEYTYRHTFAPMERTIERLKEIGATFGCIMDRNNTYGHYKWQELCKKNGIKPLLGVELGVVDDPKLREKQGLNYMGFIAINNSGLKELYHLVKQSTSDEYFYYTNRIGWDDVNALSDDVIVFSGLYPDFERLTRNVVIDVRPDTPHYLLYRDETKVAVSDNYYLRPEDLEVYELLCWANYERKDTPMWLMTEDEWRASSAMNLGGAEADSCIATASIIGSMCDAELKPAPMIRYPEPFDLEGMVYDAAKGRGVDLSDPVYMERVQKELRLIAEKDFGDYFMVVKDVVDFAKKHMCVGPARGSSAGSLVCYILGITEIDPIPYGLIFERFIDVNRFDLPDIDIDFSDHRRHMVFEYLERKYGHENVAKIGTVLQYKPKSAITSFAKTLGIPVWEVQEVKDSIIERSGGDARAAMCIKDTFETTDAAKDFLKKYPKMELVEFVENHASSSGTHAAGIIVCNVPLDGYGTVSERDQALQMDKHDAEALNLLKIDVLGLRTLTILEEVCERIGKPYSWLWEVNREDDAAFKLFREVKLAGIFQFEGYALQSLTRQIEVNCFDDINAITALARPGALHSGGASMWVKRRMGLEEVEWIYDHDIIKDVTEETYGAVVYQEQVMRLVKELGKFSWADTAMIRKAMSKTLGDEFFSRYKGMFIKGCKTEGLTESDADLVWKSIMTMGSWSFNKSHSVSYALLSYLTAFCKAHYPVEFALANLNNAKDEDSTKRFLREFLRESGLKYRPVDIMKSELSWTADGEYLIGPLTNIKGIGDKMAEKIITIREDGGVYPAGIQKKLDRPITPFDDLFEAEELFSEMYKDPRAHKINANKILRIREIEDKDGEYVFIGKLRQKNLRDLNEYSSLVKRNMKVIDKNNLYLNMNLEDDTDMIICTINRYRYNALGKDIVENGIVDKSWYLVRGTIKGGWRRINITKIKKLR